MLKEQVIRVIAQCFKNAYPQSVVENNQIEVTPSTQPRFGHYQCNSAMKLTKQLGEKPIDIANKLIANLELGMIERAEVAGPGFINLTLSNQFLTEYTQKMLSADHFAMEIPERQKIIIDFSSPNIAKEMHVGHLRSTIIGDTFARLFEFNQHEVLRLNHVGDWGTAFGMLIAYIKQYHPEILNTSISLTQLVQYYRESKKIFDEDPDFKKQSQLEVVKLQSGEANSLKIWQLICEISRKAYQEIYDLLDIHLIERGESYYNNQLQDVVNDIESKGLIQLSEGAKCVFLEGYANREGEPLPLMLQKSDGGFNYATTDMAAIRHRVQDEKGDRLIYVTDLGQATHFAMVFAAAEKAGYLDRTKVRVDHAPFGLVLGPDGKKFKTRSGETERLIDLLQTAVNHAEEILRGRGSELSEAEIKSIAKTLGINAIKYSDLSCNRISDYSFSYEKMLRFEGNTAAFLMYSYVRIQGIKRKIQNPVVENINLQHPSEIDLGLHLARFEEILNSVADDLMPNRLCEYLYELAQKFNAFFRDCRVEGVTEQGQRLALCELTAMVLKSGLTILGLETVVKM